MSDITHPQSPSDTNWVPPSDRLEFKDGMWCAATPAKVFYPEADNDLCFQVEEGSFWFRHRMDCVRTVIQLFPPAGTLYDIGGGNGFVALALQNSGTRIALVEPGRGARNALLRGVRHVIQATLDGARFLPHSLPAVGAFDVVEHISDDVAFLHSIREQLVPRGRFYCTVPASPALWSGDDVHAGHFRRYDRQTLSTALHKAGFTIEFVSPLFLWLFAPIYLLRTLPYQLRLKLRTEIGTPAAIQSAHHLPALINPMVAAAHTWELARLQARRSLPFGTSLLCVARANPT